MKPQKVDIVLGAHEPLYITPYSDVHFGSSNCHIEAWKKHYHERAQLPNSHFMSIGDFNDMILPQDLKRFTPTTQAERLRGRDDVLNAELEATCDLISSEPKAKWLMWGMGNHEWEVMHRHSVNFPALVSQRLGIPYGNYAGFLSFTLFPKSRSKGGGGLAFTILYHHGAWGGEVMEGLPGAKRYVADIIGWNIFVFGHNHSAHMHMRPCTNITPKGLQQVYNRYIVNTGGWQLQAKTGDATSFAERKGYSIKPITCPLIKVWMEKPQDKWEVRYEVTF